LSPQTTLIIDTSKIKIKLFHVVNQELE